MVNATAMPAPAGFDQIANGSNIFGGIVETIRQSSGDTNIGLVMTFGTIPILLASMTYFKTGNSLISWVVMILSAGGLQAFNLLPPRIAVFIYVFSVFGIAFSIKKVAK